MFLFASLYKMLSYFEPFFCLGLLISLKYVLCGSVQAVTASTNDEGAPWYENLPAVAMDYKIHIDPGKEDCFFQYVNPGATFYVNFQVSWFLFMMFLYDGSKGLYYLFS